MDQYQKNFFKGKYKGITEFLAFKTNTFNEVMLIFNKELSVVNNNSCTYQ